MNTLKSIKDMFFKFVLFKFKCWWQQQGTENCKTSSPIEIHMVNDSMVNFKDDEFVKKKLISGAATKNAGIVVYCLCCIHNSATT